MSDPVRERRSRLADVAACHWPDDGLKSANRALAKVRAWDAAGNSDWHVWWYLFLFPPVGAAIGLGQGSAGRARIEA